LTASNPTIRELLAEGTRRLQPTFGVHGGSTTPELDAEVLLAHILAVPRPHLRSHPEEPVGTVGASYRALLERRALGVPLAYLTGAREFWSLPLRITPAVLVPRPETELLVERALALGNVTQASIAELGTGSGAVALALASERPHWRVTAIELSPEALAVARANAEQLALTGIDFRQGSWFEPLAEERFDLILSNPPYVASDDPALDEPSLAHEPRLALTPGADALECLRSIAHGAPQHLRPGGWLLLEHGTAQGAALRNELVLAGLRSVRSHHDLAGHERVTEGQYDPI
jgi:release factor glutamine methyltransferase